jgi:hypothetical protein
LIKRLAYHIPEGNSNAINIKIDDEMDVGSGNTPFITEPHIPE